MSPTPSDVNRPPTPSEVAEGRRVRVLAREQLPVLRRAATNWRNGVGLGGVLTLVVTVAAGPEAVMKLAPQDRFNGAWLLAIGAALVMLSLALAMYASFGLPLRARVGGLGALNQWEDNAVTWGVIALCASLAAAAFAFLALACAIGVLVFQIPFLWDFPGWTVRDATS